MDNLTHTLAGVTLVRAGFGRHTPGATAAMVLASNIPDIDILAAFDGGLAYLAAHRGTSHGPLGVVLLGCVAALVVAGWRAARPATRAAAWEGLPRLALIGIAGALLHVLMDVPTIYGTRALSPFDETWFSLDWMPIIDVYLWGILLMGFLAARLRAERRTAIARTALVLMIGLYGVRAAAHRQALSVAASTRGDGTASPCASAPVLTRHPTVIEAATAGPGACLQAAALPSFLSPFQWRLVRQEAGGYELREMTLWQAGRGGPRIFVPSTQDAWTARARGTATGRVFYAFSRFPATRSAAFPDGTRRVRAIDVRFLGPPPRPLEPDPRTNAPFVITVDVGADGVVRAERLGT